MWSYRKMFKIKWIDRIKKEVLVRMRKKFTEYSDEEKISDDKVHAQTRDILKSEVIRE